VGLSHSGADIAFELAKAGHPTYLSGKAAGQLPIRVVDTSRARVGWPIVQFVFRHVLTIRTPIGRKMRPHVRSGGGPLIRYRLPDLDAAGIERHDAKTVGVRDGKPELADGTVLDVRSIVWATGYRPDYAFIHAPVIGSDGWPEEVRGVSPTVPGLYFLGVPFQYAFSSMLITGAGRDARYVVDRIAERVRTGAGDRAADRAAQAQAEARS
jgi:putative flavoprotein involved in K+ transport